MNKEFQLFGIFGFPAAHSLSPLMQEAAFEAAGLKAFYLIFELDRVHFKQAMKDLRKIILGGFNVTVPHKETVIPYLDGLRPEARAIGAVNTVFRQGKKWMGANTDMDGFLNSLKHEGNFQPKQKKALVLGAGGAARAVIYGLAKEQASSIAIANRHPERAKKIISDFKKIFPRTEFRTLSLEKKELSQGLEGSQLIVNATSVGLKPKDPVLVPEICIPKAQAGSKKLFFDLVYHPLKTPFLEAAQKKNHRTLGGLGMLVLQGARAFEYWTGRPAPVSVMRRTLVETLKARGNKK